MAEERELGTNILSKKPAIPQFRTSRTSKQVTGDRLQMSVRDSHERRFESKAVICGTRAGLTTNIIGYAKAAALPWERVSPASTAAIRSSAGTSPRRWPICSDICTDCTAMMTA